MGLQRVVAESGSVRFSGPLRDGLKACLWSRAASRVLLRLCRFEAMDADALYEGVAALPWTEHLSPDGTLRVDFVGRSLAIRDERFGAQKVKDAIVDSIRSRLGRRPNIDREEPDLIVNAHLRNNLVTISLDLSGDSLHLRTPGRQIGMAPLKETLAAHVLLQADWPRRARAGESLIDPMCGSGTFALEAAGMALDSAPGLVRTRFGFTRWLGHDGAVWSELVAEAWERSRAGANEPCRIHARDIDPSAVSMAEQNAYGLGLSGIEFSCQPFEDMRPVGDRPGLIVANPPYGERLESTETAEAIYRSLGNTLRQQMLGWDAFILAPMGRVSHSLGLKPRARHLVFNGPRECRLLEVAISETAPIRMRSDDVPC